MGKSKVAITLDPVLLRQLDYLVGRRVFANRSVAIEEAIQEKLGRISRCRLALECAKLDPVAERRIADEGLAGDRAAWPEY